MQESRRERTVRSTDKTKGDKFFKDTKVETCSHVKIINGKPFAVSYRATSAYSTASKVSSSTETHSLSRAMYKPQPVMHAGMAKKPLVPYHPDSYRNRLPTADARKPKSNASQIEIGDRGMYAPKHFTSTYKNNIGAAGLQAPISNGGILARQTQWLHKKQNR